MSKGNPFLSQMRGKLGDVVFYRQDGEQITRSRNRHPRNPKSEPQLYQRAVMATITAAYKAGKALFDHSFEGLSVGAANQREFIKRNANLLRSTMAADIDNSLDPIKQLGRVIGPGTASPVGFEGMIISNGSYPQGLFTFAATSDAEYRGYTFGMPAALANEKRSEYAARLGLVAGDFYTICGFAYNVYDSSEVFIVNGVEDTDGAVQYRGQFFFIRLGVRTDFISSEAAMAGSKFGDIFFLDTYDPIVDSEGILDAVFTRTNSIDDILRTNEFGPWDGYVGVIRSRKDVDLRSPSVLHASETQVVDGIISSLAIQAWQQGTSSLGNSRLILEGGGFSRRGGVTPSPTPPSTTEVTECEFNGTSILDPGTSVATTNHNPVIQVKAQRQSLEASYSLVWRKEGGGAYSPTDFAFAEGEYVFEGNVATGPLEMPSGTFILVMEDSDSQTVQTMGKLVIS